MELAGPAGPANSQTSILKNHPLMDGNKRLGWLATAVFLELNGAPVTAISNDDVYGLVMEVAAGELDLAEISDRLLALVD